MLTRITDLLINVVTEGPCAYVGGHMCTLVYHVICKSYNANTLGPWPMTVMLGIRTVLDLLLFGTLSFRTTCSRCMCIQVNLRQGSHKKRSLICVGTVFHYAL